MNKFKKLLSSDGAKSVYSSLISILIGLLFGFIAMIVIALINGNGSPIDGLTLMLKGPFSSKIADYRLTNIGNMIFYSVPLIFTGLSVAIAYKTGLFNIGAPGQYVMGTVGSLFVALTLEQSSSLPGVVIWLLALLAGAAAGALWGAIPGILKAFFNINEVIICIMTNWISANLASWIFSSTENLWSTETNKGGFLAKVSSSATPKLGNLFNNSLIDIGIFVAIIVAIVIYVVMNKTTFGYELKACGFNKDASKYAGLNEKRNIILSMVIAGALSGMGASLYYLNSGIEYKFITAYSALPSYGFNGIASAFLANCNPIGIVFSSVFIRYLNMGGDFLVQAGFNRYVADVVVAVIIYMAGFTRIIKEGLLTKKKKVTEDTRFKKEDYIVKENKEGGTK